MCLFKLLTAILQIADKRSNEYFSFGENVMKKKTVLITIISIFLIIAVFFTINQKSGPSYLGIIMSIWDISLPTNCKEIYQTDDGASFLGDGLRYHVFKYETGIAFNELIPEEKISEDDTERILGILSYLHVEKEFYLDFNDITFGTEQKQTDNSKLYLCYSMPQKILYVIEDIH